MKVEFQVRNMCLDFFGVYSESWYLKGCDLLCAMFRRYMAVAIDGEKGDSEPMPDISQ